MTENRKRLRDEDTCEFMPLSKRINNLHINNLASGSHLGGAVTLSSESPSYDPGIDSSQSNYFHNNKLLFELHLERIRRSGQPICLEEGVLSSIFTKNFNISLCDMIEYCSNVKITRDDGLPEQMCSNCMYKLGIAYHFKQSCESADLRLRQYLGLRLSKFSDVAVMTDPITPARTTIIKKCKCKPAQSRKPSSNYKRKPEVEKLKRGPKPKPKPIHQCYECNKEFRCQAQLEMHVRTHTGVKPFVCMYCPRQFTQKHNLTIHLRVHTGEKPFQCEICSKRFSAQGNLHAHLKIHTGQRDHVCTICNKSFITSSELTRHTSKHRGVRNFKCELCGAAYIHARDLKLHKIKKHQIGQETKIQDNFNNAGNIDIISIDGKDPPPPIKDATHLIPHLISEKPNVSIPEPMFPFDQRKDVFTHYSLPSKSLHSCAICGEGFDYVTELSQHYALRHKGLNSVAKPYGIA